MMNRKMVHIGAFNTYLTGLFMAFVLLIGWGPVSSATSSLAEAMSPVAQSELSQDTIYAYRDWQSVGIRVEKEEWIEIRATGSWLYTPGDYHGPMGHPRFSAPSFYPLSGAGGALIGRIGGHGRPFYIGAHMSFLADKSGVLYLRINDDILSDNDGSIIVDVTVN